MTDVRARFVADVLGNRHNRAIFSGWRDLALPDGWLVAGCLFQSVWNLRSQRPPEARIKDYDLFYFDASDLSPSAEEAVQARVGDVLGDLGVMVEAKNQARVHEWYPAYFGRPYPKLANSRDGIDRFLVLATCVAMRPNAAADDGWDVYAPYGLDLLYEGTLTPNPLTDFPELFEAKAGSYRERWPWLTVGSSIA